MSFAFILLFACEPQTQSDFEFAEIRPSSLNLNSIPHPIPGGFDSYNDPSIILSSEYNSHFDSLPLDGSLNTEPWSGYYWPKHKGGIAFRWQSNEQHDYVLYEEETLHELDAKRLSELSPAEKYDLLVGNYNYPLTHRILAENTANESAWTGICHGWSPASIAYQEPPSVIMTNPDGLTIPFGSSDIKALLSYYRAEVVRSPYKEHEWRAEIHVVGSVCTTGVPSDPNCFDTNPGAFHIVLANQVGLLKRGMNIDADTTYEKWNQPVYAYDTTVLKHQDPNPSASPSAVIEVVVQTDLEYTLEIEPQWVTAIGSSEQSTRVETYLYSLELDADGHIVGGQWLTENNNSFITLEYAYNYLITLDRTGDGTLDYSREEAAGIIWTHFRFPDYIWVQNDVAFPEGFKPLASYYDILATTPTNRQKLYDYFGTLGSLYATALDR